MKNYAYYLKVEKIDEKTEDIDLFLDAYNDLLHRLNKEEEEEGANQWMVGYFNKLFSFPNIWILEFYPYSVDMDVDKRDTVYETMIDALMAALGMLRDNGFRAVTFPLQEYVEGITFQPVTNTVASAIESIREEAATNVSLFAAMPSLSLKDKLYLMYYMGKMQGKNHSLQIDDYVEVPVKLDEADDILNKEE